MKLFFKVFFRSIRLILGPVLLFSDWVTSPRGIRRSADLQQQIDVQTGKLALYQFRTCPFCIKARRAIKRLSLKIELLDAQKNPEHRQALLQGGGQIKVPCLRITEDDGSVRWLYESDDIIQYLESRYGEQAALQS
jgi:glutaredoxin